MSKADRTRRALQLNRRQLLRALRVEILEARRLMAADTVDDVFALSQSSTLHLLANDSNGSTTQKVSSVNLDYGLANNWFVPQQPGTTTPQRSLIQDSLVHEPNFANFGDVDLFLDRNGDIATTDDVALTRTTGMVIGTVRENIVPASGASSTNLVVVNYNTHQTNTTNTWLSTEAAPQNNGEGIAKLAAAYFPYSSGWRAAAFNNATINHAPAGAGITATSPATGRYEITVTGVGNSLTDGYLFTIAAGNSDNYTQSMPLGGNKWAVARRDNSAAFSAGESGTYNVLYIPRNAEGLIGGHVEGNSTLINPLYQAAGNFTIQRESNGLWRMRVAGHSPTTGVLLLESNDTSRGAPVNAYFSYQADGNDFLIRQLEGNTMNPLNDDFSVVFIPFVNSLQVTAPLSINSLGSPSNPTSGISEQGVALVLNSDGTVRYSESAALRAVPGGGTVIDRFVYEATDDDQVDSSTVTVTWHGVNDAPIVVNPISSQTFVEDAASVSFDLASVFNDIDLGDVLTYTVDTGLTGLLTVSLEGTTLMVGPSANAYGFTTVSLTARDTSGATVSTSFTVSVTAVVDNPVAVADAASTNKLTAINIDAVINDFHPDTSLYSVAAASIYGNPLATTNETSIFTVNRSTPLPNQLTIQSAGNLGDVAVGRNGSVLSYNDGVLLGTVADATPPYQTVNTYAAFSSYGFATDTGIGGGERNSPVNAAFFPFVEGWISGHVGTSGNLISGVGVTQANIVKKGIGLWEVTVPGMESTGAFFDDGMLFATVDSNNDNIISVNPRVGGGWEVRIVDSDALVDAFNGEDTPWSFVYVPANTPSLFGGHVANDGSFIQSRQYGGVTAERDGSGLSVSVPGFTPADGVMMAIVAASGLVIDPGSGDLIPVPAARAVMATAAGNRFRLEALASGSYVDADDQFYFMFIPYAQPLELIAGLDLEVSAVSATSALGATVTLNSDGTINYNPATGGTAISGLLPGQSTIDTFTYTLTDHQVPPRTAIGTITVTVTGENRQPTANADVINSNEVDINGGVLTVLHNDTDPDLPLILGNPIGISSANLSVDGTGVWSVTQTGAAPNNITLGATSTGNAELLSNGAPISRNDGVVLATVREIQSAPNTNSRLVQAYTNSFGGTSLAVSSFGVDQAANAQVGVSYFKFTDNWIGGHVDSTGNLLAGNGVTGTDIVRKGVGRYEITLSGLSNSSVDGFLLTIGSDNSDNVVSSRAIPGTNRYEVVVRDNSQDLGTSEDGGFSFVFVPRTAENLVAGVVNATSANLNALRLGIGEFSLSRQAVTAGGFEWKLTIPGHSPSSGMLILANQNNLAVEDNYLAYQDDGAGNFIIRSQDMPNLANEAVPFTFVFVPFNFASQPKFRPLTGGLTVQSVDSTSARGAALSINSDGTILYSPGTIFDAMYDGDFQTDTFQYTMTDGFGGTSSATVTVNVNGVGQPVPVILSSGSGYYALGDGATSLDPAAALGTSPIPFLNGSVLTVSLTTGAQLTDQLVIRNEGSNAGQIGVNGANVTYAGTVIATFTGGNDASPIAITFNSAATLESAQAVLRAISFSNVDSDTSAGTRTFSVVLVDGNGKSAGPSTKSLTLGLVRRRTFQQNVDHGFGSYASVSDIELSQVTPNTPQPMGRVAADGLLVDQGTTDQTHVLLRFADIFGTGLGQIPTDAIITSARLVLNTNNSGHGGTMHRLLTDFDFNQATWNSTGAGIQANDIEARSVSQSQVGVASANGTTGSGATSIGVLADILAWQSGETNFGWAFLPHATGTDGWGFSPSETSTANLRPQLNIEWLPAGTEFASFRQGVNGYNSTVDTYLQQGSPTTTADTATTIWVDFDAVNNNQALLRFDDIIGSTLGQIPPGSTVVSAKLTLASMVSNAPGDGGTFHTMLADWGNSATWTSLGNGVSPDGTEASIVPNTFAGNSTLNPNVVGGYSTFDVTADVQHWVDATLANKGWVILPWTSGSDGWAIQSSESANIIERPILQVYYIANPATVTPTITVSPLTKIYDGTAFIANAMADDGTDGFAADTNGANFVYTYYAGPGLSGGVIPAPLNVGAYSVDVQYLGNANYLPVASTAFDFSITPAELAISGITAASKTYDGNSSAALVGTPSYVGLVNGESFAVTGNGAGTFASTNVGTSINVTVTGYNAPTSNYTLTQPTGLNADITPVPLTITAEPKSKTVGDVDPALTFTTSAFVNGETVASALTGGLTRAPGETAGIYAISQGTLSAVNGNYDITFVGANFTINPAAAAPTLVSVVVNGADGYSNNNQRSMLTSLVVTFSTPVSLEPGAFSITNIGIFTATNVNLGSSQILVTANATNDVFTIRFGSGTSVNSRAGTGVRGNSLADGNYRLTIDRLKVSNSGGSLEGNNVYGATAADNFFRLYGDSNGDGRVDGVDLFNIRAALASSAAYNSAFDWDGNGSVSAGVDTSNFSANQNRRRRLF